MTDGRPTAEGSLVRSLDRGLQILDALIAAGTQSLSHIANAAGLPRSTTHRLLMTLQSRGYVAGSDGESGMYRLGVKGMWLTSARNTIHGQLVQLQSLTGETVNFGAIVGKDVEYIDRVISDHALRWGVDIGSRIQMHCSGMGKAILAYREDLLPDQSKLMKRTDRTISDLSELRAQFEAIRHDGFAIDDEEFMDGVMCVAAPIRDETGKVIGAVSIAGPTVRFHREAAVACASSLIATAAGISGALGYVSEARE